MKKVLILTYYWPPSGGAGVQRWLKFVKYLPEFGIEPIIYTHSNGEVPSLDESLVKEVPTSVKVIRTEIWEPYGFYKKLSGKKNEKINSGFLTETKPGKSFVHDLSIWIRGNFFIPDARKFWIKPSVKFLTKYLEENPVDVIISTGPPHSMHLIALKLKRKFNISWISDFRDPWTNIDFYQDLKLTGWADRKHKKLENAVLLNSDISISVGPTLTKELIELGSKHCETITNGFDTDDLIQEDVTLDNKISIAHIGSFTKTRNPQILLEVLNELKSEVDDLESKIELKLVGKVDYTIAEMIANFGLNDIVRKIDYLPHNQVLLEQKKSHALLLIVNETPNAKGIITGKVFEYLAAKRPIIAIAPEDGDLAGIINETKSGVVVNSENKSKLKIFIKELMEGNTSSYQFDNIDKYTRKNLTQELVEIINSLSSDK